MILRILAIVLISTCLLFGQPKYEKRLNAAAEVFTEIMEAPDNAIPQDLLDHAACIVIVLAPRREPSSLEASTAEVSYPAARIAVWAGPVREPCAWRD